MWRIVRKSNFFLPFMAGGLSAIAFIYMSPLLLATGYAIFILSLYDKPFKVADRVGLFFGVSYFFVGLVWFFRASESYLANGQLVLNGFGILAIILMSMLFAFFAMIVTLFPVSKRSSFVWFALIVPSVLAFLEWIKIYYFTGFPWFQASHIFTGSFFKGWYAIFGEVGVSFFFYFFVSLICFVVVSKNKKHELIKFLSLLVIFGVLTKFVGSLNFSNSFKRDSSLKVLLVNGNSNRGEKEYYSKRILRMQRYQQMVFGVANEPDVSVWPESASGIGVYDEIKKELHNGFSKISSKEIEVLFGGYLQEGMFVKNVIFSSMSSKEIYAKQHLVPVGEYIPSWFSLFDVWIPGAFQGSTVAGLDQSSNVLLDKHAVGFTPIICYEVLFNGEIRNKSKRSGLLVVFSDLSAVKYPWVKNYFFNIARIRAMELKKPMLVSSNHGVTGVISGGGGVVERVEGKEDYIFEEIIPSWEETPFLLYGNTLTLFFLLFLFVIGGGLIALYPASYAK